MKQAHTKSLYPASGVPFCNPPKAAASLPRGRLYESPKHLLFFLVCSIFFAETGVMFLLARFNFHPLGWEAFIDASALVLILSPTFYFFFFRPFTLHISKLEKSKSRIKSLSQELILSSEEERNSLSRDLHDEFGQALTTLTFKIESLKNSFPAGLEDQRQDCDKLQGIVETLGDKTRNFSGMLRPVLLDKLGIVAALQGHVENIRSRHPHLEIEFEAFGLKKRPAPQTEIVLYRICQEGLNNVLKHAQATKAYITLTHSHPNIILTLKDDGKGFDLQHQTDAVGKELQGLGLLGMRERVEAAGGRLNLFSEEGQGTLVRAELPMPGTGNVRDVEGGASPL